MPGILLGDTLGVGGERNTSVLSIELVSMTCIPAYEGREEICPLGHRARLGRQIQLAMGWLRNPGLYKLSNPFRGAPILKVPYGTCSTRT